MDDDYQLFGLAFGCPYQERKDNCPIQEVKELSFGEKFHWINKLSNDVKIYGQEVKYTKNLKIKISKFIEIFPIFIL